MSRPGAAAAAATVPGIDTALLIDDDRHVALTATAAGERLLVDPEAFARATGWHLRPEGLCRGDVCVPVRDRDALEGPGGAIDLAAAAAALGRPAVVDARRHVAALGLPAPAVAEQMTSLVAPDFTLPDLDGCPVSLHDFDRRKRLLLAWASW